MFLSKRQIKYSLFFFIIVLVLGSCIPIRKQIVLKDSKNQKLKEAQSMDKVVESFDFEYKLKQGNLIKIDINRLSNSSTEINSLMNFKDNVQSTNLKQGGSLDRLGYKINEKGNIVLPILGTIHIEGLTLDQAEKIVQKKANDIFNDVYVKLLIINYQVFLGGEVKSPGDYNISNSEFSLLELIYVAGGFSDFANRSKIKIVRKINSNQTKIFYVSLAENSVLSNPDYYLYPGDIIVVEPVRLKNLNKYYVPNLGLVTTILSSVLLIFSLSRSR